MHPFSSHTYICMWFDFVIFYYYEKLDSDVTCSRTYGMDKYRVLFSYFNAHGK